MIKKILSSCLIFILVILLMTSIAYSQKKLAQTGFQFLSVGTNARATAMGEAYTTVGVSSEALFYNPAGLALLTPPVEVALNQMEWITDIKYMSASFGLNPAHGQYGVFGLSFLAVDYGEFLWTRVASNGKGFEDIPGWPEPGAVVMGLGYAKQLTDRFSVGGQIKYVGQDLGKSIVPFYTETDTLQQEKSYKEDVLAFDFGTIYRTGFKSLAFGMTVRNFSQEIKYEKEGFQLPLTFRIGISMNAFDFLPDISKNMHSFLVSIDAVHPRSFPEYLNIGGEYLFMDLLALRVGYVTNQDDYAVTTGFGIKKFGFAIDYSFTPYDMFADVNRFSVKFSL